MVAILVGALVGLGVGFMIGFAAFGVWGGVIGATVGLLAGGLILTTVRRWSQRELPEESQGGAVEVAGTEFRAERGTDHPPEEPPRT
jgi:predicted lipid-binding transport protein (Tim44 family)